MAEELSTTTPEQQETPIVQSTGALQSADILSKMQSGEGLYEGETLPNVPEGMPAKSFYGQFPGGATVYSQQPFFEGTFKSTESPLSQQMSFLQSQQDAPQEESFYEAITQSFEPIVTGDPDDYFSGEASDDPTLGYSNSPIDNLSLQDVDFKDAFNITDVDLQTNFTEMLDRGFKNIQNGLNKEVNEFTTDLNNLFEELGQFVGSPLEFTANKIQSSIQNFSNTLTEFADDPTQVFSTVGEYLGKVAVNKGLQSLLIGIGLNPIFALPAALGATNLLTGEKGMFSDESQIGRPTLTEAVVKDENGRYLTASELRGDGHTQDSTLAGYVNGVGVDKDGNLAMTGEYYAGTLMSTSYTFQPRGWGNLLGKTSKEIQAQIDKTLDSRGGMLDHEWGKGFTKSQLENIKPVEEYTTPLRFPPSDSTYRDMQEEAFGRGLDFSQEDMLRGFTKDPEGLPSPPPVMDEMIEANKQANKQAFESSGGGGDGVGDSQGMGDQSPDSSGQGGYGWT